MKRRTFARQSPPAFVSTSHTTLSSAWRFSTSTAFIAADIAKWTKVVKAGNIKVD